MSETHSKNRRVAGLAGLAAAAMFGFGFALVPLYDVLCDALGINGSFTEIEDGTYNAEAEAQKALSNGVDMTRTVDMQFLVTDNYALDLDFRAMTKKLAVHPGKVSQVSYYVKNRTDKTMVIQAIPDITPNKATKYLAKIECFCFNKQTLKPGEEKEMPLRFIVNSALPKNIPVLTLTYRFIDLQRNASLSEDTKPEQKVAG
jgi:cytochrome c oxidase assembly protein subunit 11